MGRWARETLGAITDATFWAVLQIVMLTHRVMDHHLLFLQHSFTHAELETTGGCTSQLVCGRARRFALEFDALLDADLRSALALATEAGISHHHAICLHMEMLAHHGVTYHRRVVSQLEETAP
eukprot:15445915-Alexandrium_andersonii.AAC.1